MLSFLRLLRPPPPPPPPPPAATPSPSSVPPRTHPPPQKTNKNDDSYISLYNSLMKLVFLASSAAILFLMRGAKGIRQTRDAAHDTFRVAFLVAPAALLALLFSADRSRPHGDGVDLLDPARGCRDPPAAGAVAAHGQRGQPHRRLRLPAGDLSRVLPRQLVLSLDDGTRVQAVAR